MQAVDATVRPEVEEYYFAKKVLFESQWLRVEPDMIGWEFLRHHSLLLFQGSAFEAS
jgi:hypothetical protein